MKQRDNPCGCGVMLGDGYTYPYHCEFVDLDGDEEPDSGPWYCSSNSVSVYRGDVGSYGSCQFCSRRNLYVVVVKGNGIETRMCDSCLKVVKSRSS